MVLSEQTWELVLLLVKAEQWDYLELMHECSTVGSDNLKGADLGERRGVACVCVFDLARASQLRRIQGRGSQRDTLEIKIPLGLPSLLTTPK